MADGVATYVPTQFGIALSDEELELVIHSACNALAVAKSREAKVIANSRLCYLVRQRSTRQIDKMERERGLS